MIKPQPIATDEVKAARKEVLDWEKNNRTALNRAVINDRCVWQATKNSPGCAVGRLCTPALQQILSTLPSGEDPTLYIPDSVKKLGHPFLQHIQALHDSPENWTDKGLSNLGMETWDEINRAFVQPT